MTGRFEYHLPSMKQWKEQPSEPISALWPAGYQQASSNAQFGMRQGIDSIAGFGKWPKSSEDNAAATLQASD
jgi:hypothetical protein